MITVETSDFQKSTEEKVWEKRKADGMKTLKVRLTFFEEILGTASGDPDIHDTYITSKAPNAKNREEEIATLGVEKVSERSMTIFPRLKDGTPILFDYQIRGFFKDSCGMLRNVKSTHSSKIKAYKKTIDGLIFVYPRHIPFNCNGDLGECQRPLRASTIQGERVALAHSETVPAGSTVEIEIGYLGDTLALIKEWLNYGSVRGIGQWRNSGKGKFIWEEI